MKSNKNFAQRIYCFLDKYAGIRPNYDPQHDDEYEKYTSPDAAQMRYCADMIAKGIKPLQCHSEWGSGGYKPYSSREGREVHDYLVKEIYKFINSKEQIPTSRDWAYIQEEAYDECMQKLIDDDAPITAFVEWLQKNYPIGVVINDGYRLEENRFENLTGQITEEDIVQQFPEDNESDPNSGIDDDCYAKREGARWAVKKMQNSRSVPDIRNKLTPFKNLIAMIENGLAKGSVQVHDLVLKEIEECKKSIEYLSSKPEN